MKRALLLLMAALPVAAQDVKIPPSLEKLAAKAAEVVDVTLDGQTLQIAGKFLSGKDPDEAKVKNLINGLKGIYVRSFEFDKEGEYSPSDVEALRSQARGPGWSRLVGVVSRKSGENAEIFIKLDGGKVGGLVIVSAEPKELTFVNIVGSIDMDQLSELGGHFGVPEIQVHSEKKPAAKD